jgi:hypothetical protein
MYLVQDCVHHRKYILYFHGKYIKKSAARRHSVEISAPGDTAEWRVCRTERRQTKRP